MSCSETKNPLKRYGTSHEQRFLNGLKNGYVAVDERDYSDWIVFASRFAEYLNYFDSTGEATANWKPFFESDISAVLGSIAIQNVDEYKQAVKARFGLLKNDSIALDKKKEALGTLFAAGFTLCKGVDYYLQRLSNENAFRSGVQNLILTKMQPGLQKLLSYYKGAESSGLIKDVADAEWKVFNRSVQPISILLAEGLSAVWIKEAADWDVFYNTLPGDLGIFGTPTWDPSRRINHAANHNLFSGLFDLFLFSFSKLIKDAEEALQESLEQNIHQPHYTLFLAFLRLFRFAKDQLNTLGQRHLDFYYKDVLRLEPRKAIPNRVHVITNLARHVDAFLLKQGTLFKAGKDGSGKDLFYALDRDVLINKATVSKLLSVYKATDKDKFGNINNEGRIFASPVSNSSDGSGSDLKSRFAEWHPFANKAYQDGVLSAINMPLAKIGFAIASANLLLTEGDRTINLKLAPALSAEQLAAIASVECYLTTEKGWYKVFSPSWFPTNVAGGFPASVLSLRIPADAPSIVNYNASVHEGNFHAQTPLLTVFLINNTASTYPYQTLKNSYLQKVELEVKVGLDDKDAIISGGLKDLVLSNDIGVLDPSKPFLPFGPAPKSGASFIIGNQELFKKKNAWLIFNVEWKDLPKFASDIDFNTGITSGGTYVDANPKVSAFSLEKGEWKELAPSLSILSDFVYASGNHSFLSKSEITFPDSLLQLPEDALVDYHSTYSPYGIRSANGFIKLKLKSSFGHEEYQNQLTKYLIDQAKTTPTGSPSEPRLPYTPTIQSLSVHYKAAVNVDFSDPDSIHQKDIQFFHIYPFGEAEQHAEVTLLPQFAADADPGKQNEAEFYIGLDNLKGGQSVNVLFQVLEGSSNPQIDKPDEHVSWSYLGSNQWKNFTREQVTDRTAQLIQSGIVSFVIPADATTDNTILSPGFTWIKASVTQDSEAVCKLLSVTAQAAELHFSDHGNAADFLDKSLPAGSISKLKEPNSAIKKIIQPYASFVGRPNENNDLYYVRVSERLRHKSRAITIWDYEHLVLEAFPSIHKVKCLNHTRFEGNNYREVAPGHVTILTIPKLENRNDVNPLRPYTNQDTLQQIKVYLSEKTSCHVKLHLRHPQFEEVRLEFGLQLADGLEFNFYHDLLQKEITGFLTPWAFNSAAQINFGGRVHKSSLINFIEERSYVDYITDVKMYHRMDETSQTESSDLDFIEASTAKSILVSAPASKHQIWEIIKADAVLPAEDCVDEYNQPKL